MGLHVVPTEAHTAGPALDALYQHFERSVSEAGVAGHLLIKAGKVVPLLCDYARWSDLVVASLEYPPAPNPLRGLTSGFRALLRRCPRPVLVVPAGTHTSLNKALLAYDGSPKAEEALYVATHLASEWKIPLVVVTVRDQHTTRTTVERARAYLTQHGVHAIYEEREGVVADIILECAETHESELILMGGYGFGFSLEVVLGSSVDHVLRASHRPMLISR